MRGKGLRSRESLQYNRATEEGMVGIRAPAPRARLDEPTES